MSRLEPLPGYEVLARIMDEALEQAQSGKGHARHADATQTWFEQPMLTIARGLAELGPGFPAGQVAKKMHEAMRLPPEARRRELLGVMNYVASLARLADEEADRDSVRR